MSEVARAPVMAFLGLFGAGSVLGLVMLATDHDTTSTGAGIAVANAVHVGLATALLVAGVLVHRRDPEAVWRFVRHPFTGAAWARLRFASIALPCTFVELVLLIGGRIGRVGRIESWRAGLLRADHGGTEARPSWSAATRTVLGHAAGSAVLTVLSVIIWYSPLRAGVQVFAGLDPDFVRDAWGGPTALGAALAHWLDGVLLVALSFFLIGRLCERRAAAFRRPDRAAGDGHRSPSVELMGAAPTG